MKFKRRLERSLSFRGLNHRHKHVNRLVDIKKFSGNEENIHGKCLGDRVSNSKPVREDSVYLKCNYSIASTRHETKPSIEMTCSKLDIKIPENSLAAEGKNNKITNKCSKLSNATQSFVRSMSFSRENVSKNSMHFFPRKSVIGRVRHSKKSDLKFNRKDTLSKRLHVAAKSGFFANLKDSLDFSSMVRSVSFSRNSGKQTKESNKMKSEDVKSEDDNEIKENKKNLVIHPDSEKQTKEAKILKSEDVKNKDENEIKENQKKSVIPPDSLRLSDRLILTTKNEFDDRYESLPFEAHTDLSPTCADMYGVDEVDNALFHKFVDINEISENSKIINENVEKCIDNKGCDEDKTSFEKRDTPGRHGGSDEQDPGKSNDWLNFCNGINLNIQEQETKENDNKSYGIDHSVCIDNPWIKQDKECGLQELKSDVEDTDHSGDFADHIFETSLGFEVNTSLRRASSVSLDSFGSSAHSVTSVKDVYFSDSEAEHNLNDTTELSSDSETSDTKQIIPYSLAENAANHNVTVRKKKDLHSKSFDENSTTSSKEPSKVKLLKSISLGLSEEKPQKKTKHLRRSLDSSLMQKDISINEDSASWKKSVKSESSEYLSPVLEKKVPKDNNKSKKGPDKDLDPNRFFTLPNPKKLRSQQNSKRKLGRLGSVSKMLSDKAHSLSNLKMGASFKLRKEIEKSKSLVSSSANSLSDMMTKKASSLTTLIRRRTNSNTAVESPFKQYGKKRTKTKKEDMTELVYEKVRVKALSKRPATHLEEQARLKRLKVTLKLARTLSLNEDDNKYIDSRSRSSSMIGRPLNSGSSSSLRSPTFLDEMMKSVDAARVKQLCSVEDEEDLSDCEESSSGSSLLLFQKQYSFDSEGTDTRLVRDSSLISVCRSCGKLRSLSSDSGSESLESPANKLTIASARYAMSLCDLNSKCLCAKRKQVQKRYSAVIDGDTLRMTNGFGADSSSRDLIPGSDRTDVLSCRTPSGKRFSLSGQRHSSMYDVRGCIFSDWDYDKSMNDIHETNSKDSIDTSHALPGALHRHRPLLDLSGENLDVTIDSEDGMSGRADDDYTQRSQSCGDLIDEEKYFGKGIPFTEIAQSMGKKTMTEYDSESFHSCSDSATTEKDINEVESDSEELSHSCGDLLDTKGIKADKAFRLEDQRKKELRKVKVKSMSSSHDALSVLVPMETINIDDIDFDGCLNPKSLTGVKVGGPITNHVKDGQNYKNAETKNNKNSNDSENDINNFVNETNEEISIPVPKACDNKKICNSTNQAKLNSKPLRDKRDIVSSKPPLPHKTLANRALSHSDLTQHDCTKAKDISDIPKRYSMIELDKENLNAHIRVSDNEIVKKRKQKRRGRTVLGMSDELNTPKSAGTFRTPISKFLFDEHQVQNYLKTVSISDKPKSVSSDNVSTTDSVKRYDRDGLTSARSLRQLSSKTSNSDEVFNQLYFQTGLPFSPYADIIESTPVKQRYSNISGISSTDFHGFTSPGFLPELPSLTEDCLYKYDVRLGYLLHSLQCDNMMVCFYSPQRNKQLMESVITPLSGTPQTPQRKVSDHGTLGKNKVPNKPKVEELPNPAAPITNVPSERLVHAGHVLRTVMLARAPHMIRDRKFHLRTYRRCMVGTEMVDWLKQQSALVHSRTQAVGMWQALVEEGIVVHVCHEHQFKDKYLFYRFQEDDEGVSTVPSNTTKRECEEDLPDIFLLLAHKGPDAMMRMILRKLPHERTSEDLEIIYEELLHIKALSHLSTMVKRELASVLLFESHAKAGTVLFNQGDEGKSWYIVLKGSVNVVIYGKGVVCTLHEGDDFGKLALVNDAPRAATIVLRDNNCHFLRVDKDDFNRILRDVEANTVRLKEHGQDVLVLEKIPSNTQCSDGSVHAHYKYSVMAGTPEKMLEHLLESRLDNKHASEIDEFLEDFLLTHVIYMPCNHLCPVLLSHYHSSTADVTEQESLEFMLNHKRCVLHFVQEWANIVGVAFKEDYTINAFLEELNSCVMDDLQDYPSLKDDIASLDSILTAHKGSPNHRLKKRSSGTFTLSRKSSKECFQDSPKKRKSISASHETIIKVYCADHTYTTVKIQMDAKVEQILMQVKDKLGLEGDLLLCEVKSTGERLVLKENDLGITTSISINSQLFVTPKEHLDALTPLPEQTGLSEGTFSVIEMFSSREMAYHMTLYDWELFTCVQEYELIYQVFGRYKFSKITGNLDLFLRRFNEIQFWIVTEMVLTSNLSKRVSLLRKFIKLAAHCKEYRNLNCFFAIVMGLSNIAVSRLSQTWEKLPSKFKKMFADFETLMDPSRNHRVYRLSVAKMAPPIIPFMPLLMKDMTFTHEGNKTYFDGLVNFEKMHMIAQTLKTVRFCRSIRLDLEAPGTLKSGDTADYIRSIKVIDNQRLLTQLSYKLEPRRT